MSDNLPRYPYPVAINYRLMTHEELEARNKEQERRFWNNESPIDDGIEIIQMHYGRLDEFHRRFNELIREFDNKP